jgi:hypothetical protein
MSIEKEEEKKTPTQSNYANTYSLPSIAIEL